MIWINGERLNVIFPPAHNGGHMDWFHFTTNSLFVEYPCFGQGSAVIQSVGSMKHYCETIYKLLELSYHILIPLHARNVEDILLWYVFYKINFNDLFFGKEIDLVEVHRLLRKHTKAVYPWITNFVDLFDFLIQSVNEVSPLYTRRVKLSPLRSAKIVMIFVEKPTFVVLLHHVEVISFLKECIIGSRISDSVPGKGFVVYTRTIVIPARSFCDSRRKIVNNYALVINCPSSVLHIIFHDFYFHEEMGLIVSKIKDGRIFFMFAWMGRKINSITEVIVFPESYEDEFKCILDMSGDYHHCKVRCEDVYPSWRGISPLITLDPKTKKLSLAKDAVVDAHGNKEYKKKRMFIYLLGVVYPTHGEGVNKVT
ncbi:hypothetical protein MKX03_037740 [Papaver bracteatum]|nr:hypothetical protein MKX03_037740 [Papaver bracteatum]